MFINKTDRRMSSGEPNIGMWPYSTGNGTGESLVAMWKSRVTLDVETLDLWGKDVCANL